MSSVKNNSKNSSSNNNSKNNAKNSSTKNMTKNTKNSVKNSTKNNSAKNNSVKNNNKNASNTKNNASEKRTRVTILGKSATSVLKALGALGYNLAQARAVCAALASGELKNSTIATALSDGRNAKYNSSAATLTKQEQAQLAKIAKQAG